MSVILALSATLSKERLKIDFRHEWKYLKGTSSSWKKCVKQEGTVKAD